MARDRRRCGSTGRPFSMYRWSIVIVSSRESVSKLLDCMHSAVVAAGKVPTSVDVMVNGNRALADAVARSVQQGELSNSPVGVRIWYIRVGDKANALNQYLHQVLLQSEVTFFLDGYVRVMPDALELLSERLALTPGAMAAGAIPRTRKSVKLHRQNVGKDGAMHGNLFAVRSEVCWRLRERGFRVPLGTYWTDGLMGAVFCFGLDPAKNRWEPARIAAEPRATWEFDRAVWWRLNDLRGHFKRLLRQAQGRLENQAIRNHMAVQRKTAESLPQTSAELVERWIAEFPAEARKFLLRSPMSLLGLRKLRKPRDWSRVHEPPEVVGQNETARRHSG